MLHARYTWGAHHVACCARWLDAHSDSVFVWVKEQEGGEDAAEAQAKREPSDAEPTGQCLQSVEIDDPKTAAILHGAGHSTYCRVPPGVEASLVSALLRDTGIGLGQFPSPAATGAVVAPPGSTATRVDLGTAHMGGGGMHDLARGEVEMFCSRQGHLTSWHFDFQENFTMQLSGAKRWRLCASPVAHPLRGHTPHFQDPSVVRGRGFVRAHACVTVCCAVHAGLG